MPATVDSSVLIAIFKAEPEKDHFLHILDETSLLIGTPTILEARIWCLRRRVQFYLEWLDEFSESVQLVTFDVALLDLAASAYARFGKGLHKAELNYGDAMAYAVAKHHGAPLLFKGGDFGRTDVPIHPASVTLA
jgi:ribonuclease VapC